MGYQKLAINLNFPIPGAPTTNFLTDAIDVQVPGEGFLIGTLGLNAKLSKLFGLFAEASISPQRSGNITANVSGEGSTASFGNKSRWSVPTNNIQWSEFNLGGSLNLSNTTGFLVGFKFNRLSETLGRPDGYSYQNFAPPVFREDYFGDLDIKTWSPYVGFRIDDRFWTFYLIWSPWLTSYNVNMPYGTVLSDSAAVFSLANAQSRYVLSGGGGNLLEAYGETKYNLFDWLGATLWAKGSWLQCRGNGNEDFVSTFFGTPGSPFYNATSGSSSAYSTFTSYLWAVGFSSQLIF